MQQITIKKVDDLNRLREYADTKGGNPVTHYIREAVSEFLENQENSGNIYQLDLFIISHLNYG